MNYGGGAITGHRSPLRTYIYKRNRAGRGCETWH